MGSRFSSTAERSGSAPRKYRRLFPVAENSYGALDLESLRLPVRAEKAPGNVPDFSLVKAELSNVRFWHLADISVPAINVRFWG
jgi:hypothetical protein